MTGQCLLVGTSKTITVKRPESTTAARKIVATARQDWPKKATTANRRVMSKGGNGVIHYPAAWSSTKYHDPLW